MQPELINQPLCSSWRWVQWAGQMVWEIRKIGRCRGAWIVGLWKRRLLRMVWRGGAWVEQCSCRIRRSLMLEWNRTIVSRWSILRAPICILLLIGIRLLLSLSVQISKLPILGRSLPASTSDRKCRLNTWWARIIRHKWKKHHQYSLAQLLLENCHQVWLGPTSIQITKRKWCLSSPREWAWWIRDNLHINRKWVSWLILRQCLESHLLSTIRPICRRLSLTNYLRFKLLTTLYSKERYLKQNRKNKSG